MYTNSIVNVVNVCANLIIAKPSCDKFDTKIYKCLKNPYCHYFSFSILSLFVYFGAIIIDSRPSSKCSLILSF